MAYTNWDQNAVNTPAGIKFLTPVTPIKITYVTTIRLPGQYTCHFSGYVSEEVFLDHRKYSHHLQDAYQPKQIQEGTRDRKNEMCVGTHEMPSSLCHSTTVYSTQSFLRWHLLPSHGFGKDHAKKVLATASLREPTLTEAKQQIWMKILCHVSLSINFLVAACPAAPPNLPIYRSSCPPG